MVKIGEPGSYMRIGRLDKHVVVFHADSVELRGPLAEIVDPLVPASTPEARRRAVQGMRELVERYENLPLFL